MNAVSIDPVGRFSVAYDLKLPLKQLLYRGYIKKKAYEKVINGAKVSKYPSDRII